MLTSVNRNGGHMLLVSFLVFLSIFLGIGLWSAKHSQGTTADYLMAGQTVPPWLVGLSAIATNNSGFMFVGMIGVTHQTGLSSIWVIDGSAKTLAFNRLVVYWRIGTISIGPGRRRLLVW